MMPIYQRPDGVWILVQAGVIPPREFATERAAVMARREIEYVEAVKTANQAIWNGIAQLLTLQREWNALDYSTTLDETGGVTSAEVGAVVFDTGNALAAVLNAGHATNMAKLL